METRCIPEPWKRGDGQHDAEPCDLRWTRKKGTDVGWRLRADLHHDVGPGACYPGVACRKPDYSLIRSAAEESQPPATAVGRERREVPCGHASALRGGPAVLSTIYGRVRPGSSAGGRWPGATLRPTEAREIPPSVGLVEEKQNQHRVFREPRFTRAVMEGGNSYPSCIEQASHTATRTGAHASGTSTRVRLAGGGNRFGMNDQKGAEPSDGERLPTRNKPSEGGALVGMWTSSESSSVGNDELP